MIQSASTFCQENSVDKARTKTVTFMENLPAEPEIIGSEL